MSKKVTQIDLCEYLARMDNVEKTTLLIELIMELKVQETIGMYWGPYVNDDGYEDDEEDEELYVYYTATGEDLIESIRK